jgi:hypothetical protein
MEKQITDQNPYYEWDLEKSVAKITEILSEFPFADWNEVVLDTGKTVRQSRSQAVQVAAMLSLFCMGLIPKGSNRMGFIYNANSQRSGKTLLAKLAIMSVCGAFKAQPWKAKDEELNKLIDAEMLAGSMYICFDNVRGYMGSQTIEGLMTSPQWTGRVLGKTQMFTAENRMNLFITGNDCIVSPDMSHRCLICDLFVEQGDVQERTVKNLIDEPWLMDRENRREIISALWGLVRAWDAAGSPTATSLGCKPRLGFERWGEIIGGIVAYAGFGNPLEKVQLESAGDSEERNIRKLIDILCHLAHSETAGYYFSEVVQHCRDEGLFEWMMDGKEDKDNKFRLSPSASSKVGLMLNRYAPRYEKDKPDKKGSPRKYRRRDDAVYFWHAGEGRHRRYWVEMKADAGGK